MSVASSGKSAEELETVAGQVADDLKQQLPEAVLIETAPLFTEGVNLKQERAKNSKHLLTGQGRLTRAIWAVNQSVAIGLQTRDDEIYLVLMIS